jgi:hypothetical protein
MILLANDTSVQTIFPDPNPRTKDLNYPGMEAVPRLPAEAIAPQQCTGIGSETWCSERQKKTERLKYIGGQEWLQLFSIEEVRLKRMVEQRV